MASLDKTIILDGKSTKDLIAASNYDYYDCNWPCDPINDRNFPVDRSLDGIWECDLYNPQGLISSEKVLTDCSEDDWMPGSHLPLLAFGMKYPEIQRVNPIVGPSCSLLGPFGLKFALILRASRRGRTLDLSGWGNDWSPDFRFLRIRRLVA